MSEINIKLLTEDAVDYIKANIDKFTEIIKNNSESGDAFIAALKETFTEDCFVVKKYKIQDFQLKTSDTGDYAEVDLENAIMLYDHLKSLPKHILSEERFWMWVILEKGYKAAIQAMSPLEPRNKNVIKDHWLFGQGQRRGLMFGVLSRAYFRVELTVDESLGDQKYMLTEFATSKYERYRGLTWRTFSNNKKIVLGALKAEKELIDKHGEQIETIRDYYPEIVKSVSKLGSVSLLDALSEDAIKRNVFEEGEKLIIQSGAIT